MDVYSLRLLHHNGAGNFFENVLHYNVDDGGLSNSYDVAKALCDQWSTGMTLTYGNLLANDVTWDYIYAKRVNAGGGPTAVKAMAIVGHEGADSYTAGVAADIALLSLDPSNRPGHMFLGALPLDAVDGDVITLAYSTLISAFTAALALPLAGGVIVSANQCVFNRKIASGYNITHWVLREKLTMLNKRTLPIV